MTLELRMTMTIYSMNWNLIQKKMLTNRIFVGPSSILTFPTNRVSPIWNHWRKSLAWREPKVLTYLWVQKLLSLQIQIYRTPTLSELTLP